MNRRPPRLSRRALRSVGEFLGRCSHWLLDRSRGASSSVEPVGDASAASDRAQRAAGDAERPVVAQPLGAGEPPQDWLARTQPGPPADWVERVREGAPHLLDPAGSQGESSRPFRDSARAFGDLPEPRAAESGVPQGDVPQASPRRSDVPGRRGTQPLVDAQSSFGERDAVPSSREAEASTQEDLRADQELKDQALSEQTHPRQTQRPPSDRDDSLSYREPSMRGLPERALEDASIARDFQADSSAGPEPTPRDLSQADRRYDESVTSAELASEPSAVRRARPGETFRGFLSRLLDEKTGEPELPQRSVRRLSSSPKASSRARDPLAPSQRPRDPLEDREPFAERNRDIPFEFEVSPEVTNQTASSRAQDFSTDASDESYTSERWTALRAESDATTSQEFESPTELLFPSLPDEISVSDAASLSDESPEDVAGVSHVVSDGNPATSFESLQVAADPWPELPSPRPQPGVELHEQLEQRRRRAKLEREQEGCRWNG